MVSFHDRGVFILNDTTPEYNYNSLAKNKNTYNKKEVMYIDPQFYRIIIYLVVNKPHKHRHKINFFCEAEIYAWLELFQRD